ncbi:HTH-type transcriptional regulator GltC [mine drainage metagenome]|uniref:HTH-type transcriptional regulator GltC n=1 Tax=mine drainage metagenome TaxID=410659 RepID=A0A1J5R3P4_9ZZZZ
MSIDILDIKYIVEIYRRKSIRRAAFALGVRQSTLSRRLKNVEEKLGIVLYERRGSGAVPTDIGCEFLNYSEMLLDNLESFVNRLRLHSRSKLGCLKIGVYTSFSSGRLKECLIEYRRKFPMVDIRAEDGERNKLLTDVRSGAIDVAIVTEDGGVWEGDRLSLWNERVIVALDEENHLAGRHILYWEDLLDEKFILSHRNSCSEFIEILIKNMPSSPALKVVHHDVALDRLLSLVGAGFGISLMAEGAAGAIYGGVVYREVHDKFGPTRLNFVAYWRKSDQNSVLKNFLSILRAHYPAFKVPERSSST